MKSKNVYIVGNGCDRRLLDSERIKNFFETDHCNVTDSPKKADFIFVNTCAMSQTAEDTSVKLIQKHLKYDGKIVVHGCLPDIAPTRFKKEFAEKKILSISSKDIDVQMDNMFSSAAVKFSNIPMPSILAPDQSLFSKLMTKFKVDEIFFLTCLSALKFKLKNPKQKLHPRIKTGSYLQISSGCTDTCTYCAIPRAIGTIKSKNINDILREYARFLENGESSFVFTADNLGLYGVDIGTNVINLFEEMRKIDSFYRQVSWTFNELHPKWLIKYSNNLNDYVKESRIKELCVPIQSGNDRILELMKRNYKILETINVLRKLKEDNVNLKITTDVIIGFPTESDDDFLETIKAIVAVRFDQVMFFSYGKRENTKALELDFNEEQNKKDIARRFRMAMKLLDSEKISYTFQ
jgi:tRNA A37 methylthiotransferase MiaB